MTAAIFTPATPQESMVVVVVVVVVVVALTVFENGKCSENQEL